MIRFILDKNYNYHIDSAAYKKVGILDTKSRVDYLSLTHIFNIFHGKAPDYFLENMQLIPSTHNTRYSYSSFCLPKVNSNGLLTFRYNSIKLWYSLPVYIKDTMGKNSFKILCKKFLMNKMEIR